MTVQIFISVRLPIESADSPFGLAVGGGVFGSQRGAASVPATYSLITTVFFYYPNCVSTEQEFYDPAAEDL